jgi:hypothetical protein
MCLDIHQEQIFDPIVFTTSSFFFGEGSCVFFIIILLSCSQIRLDVNGFHCSYTTKMKKELRPNRYLTELSSQSLVSFLVQALNVLTLYWKFIKEGMVDKPMIKHLVYHKAWIFWTFFHCLWSSKRYITHPLGTPIGENCSRRIIHEENMRFSK